MRNKINAIVNYMKTKGCKGRNLQYALWTYTRSEIDIFIDVIPSLVGLFGTKDTYALLMTRFYEVKGRIENEGDTFILSDVLPPGISVGGYVGLSKPRG